MILADLENLMGCVRQDTAFRHYPALSVVKAIVSAIERTVTRQYPGYQAKWRVTALSSPEPGSTGFEQENEDILAMTRELHRLKYQVLMVDRTKNAADHAITELGMGLLYNRRIGRCILATQDSGLLFVSFIKAVKTRIRMHLVGYDYIPESFLTEENSSSSLLRGDIAEILEQMPAQMPNALPARPRNARENTRAFLNDPRSVKNTGHHAWIAQTLACLKYIARDDWEVTFRDLVRGIRSRWRGPSPPDQTLSDILSVLGDKFFFRRTMFIYRPDEMDLFLTTHGSRFGETIL